MTSQLVGSGTLVMSAMTQLHNYQSIISSAVFISSLYKVKEKYITTTFIDLHILLVAKLRQYHINMVPLGDPGGRAPRPMDLEAPVYSLEAPVYNLREK